VLLCYPATIGKRFLSHSHLKFLLFATVSHYLTKRSFGETGSFCPIIDMTGFSTEIGVLLWSWEVKVRVTTKIIFACVYSRIVLQKEEVPILVSDIYTLDN